jgi:hypothetical protein
MAWLGTWRCRRKFTIAAADVDAALAGFPIRVSISTSSGLGNDDVSDIFDELTVSCLKLAVTLDDELTEVFVEVEYWDSGTERGELWIKATSLSASLATDLYIYYDSTQADNTAFVGVVGSVSGQSVWDANFVGVYHLAETTGNYLDSTSNGNDSSTIDVDNRTTAGLITPNSMDLNWSNSDTGIIIPDDLTLRVVDHTLEALFNIKTLHASEFPDVIYHNEGGGPWYSLEIANDPYEPRHRWSNQGPGVGHQDTVAGVSTGWLYLAGTVDTAITEAKCFLEDVEIKVDSSITNPVAGTADLRIGGEGSSSFLDGTVDEIRISDIARTEAWVLASRLSMLDEFITWSNKELLGRSEHQMIV